MNFEEKKQEGLRYIKEDNYKEALEIFSLLFYENPKDLELLEITQFLFQRITEGNYDFQPKKAEEYIYRGVARFYKGKLSESIEDFDIAISLNNKLDYAYKCKAFSLMWLEKHQESIEELEKAISINPHGEYYDDIAENYSRMGLDNKAIEFHEKAIHKSPDDARLWYNYGTHLGKMNMIAKAVTKLQKAVELYPNYDDAIYNLNYYSKKLKI